MPSSFISEYENLLSPWAARSSNSLGRVYEEPEHPYRSSFQRDRDRIIHSAAFRRLESKTQVYTNLFQEGDFYRKRLTHTLEVAQISRSIAKVLRLNEDLTEAIALAHDLGHPPFGHRGQDILNALMKDNGGFEHNTQALRIICVIEHRYPDFYGLNPTYEVREGLAKRGHGQEEPLKNEFQKYPNPNLEAQAVDIADPIAYSTHDLDDGITADTITIEMLKECRFWNEGVEAVSKKNRNLPDKILKFQVVRYIINEQITDLVSNTQGNLEKFSLKSVEDVRNCRQRLVALSPAMKEKHDELKTFLKKNMYEHSRVKRMEHKARGVLEKLFNAFLNNPNLLPSAVQKYFREERDKGNEKRIVCDYIAGMTDRFALEEYNDLFNPATVVRR